MSHISPAGRRCRQIDEGSNEPPDEGFSEERWEAYPDSVGPVDPGVIYEEEFRGFVHAIVHDLRAPMVNIRGLIAELRRSLEGLAAVTEVAESPNDTGVGTDAGPVHRAEIAETLAHIGDCVEKMSRVVGRLPEVSGLNHGRLDRTPVDPGELARQILVKADVKKCENAFSYEIEGVPMVEADPLALERVLHELIDNALKFRAPNRALHIRVVGGTDARHSWIRVRDNGRGIADADRERIFQPFRRCGPRSAAGEGVGLSVARSLMRRHGGWLTCLSAPGEGSEFTLIFPHSNQHD